MKKIAVMLATLFASFAAHAAETKLSDALDYTTLGVWVGAPLGVSARVGLAILPSASASDSEKSSNSLCY